MTWVANRIRLLGGIASAEDLRLAGLEPGWVRMAVDYGQVIHIRHGWFANLETSPEAIEARRVGGRLACVSALSHHGVADQTDSALHVAVPRCASRLRTPSVPREVVVHWYRREPGGGAQAVSVEEAWAQRARCRALRQ